MKQHTALLSLALISLLALAAPAALAADKKIVNINQADAAQLALLPRVGPSLSARIVEFREQNGKFEEPADLMLVRGIGEKTFALMEPYVAVSGETTLTEKVRVSQIQQQDSDGDSDA